uniref:Uncharacterized protein n=1 Tax=Ditylenchus dipsaci TaxID=166011 RepID=A0A915DQZ6_9BILA
MSLEITGRAEPLLTDITTMEFAKEWIREYRNVNGPSAWRKFKSLHPWASKITAEALRQKYSRIKRDNQWNPNEASHSQCPPDHAYCLLSLPKPGAATTPEMKAEEHNSPHVDPEEKKNRMRTSLQSNFAGCEGIADACTASDDDPLYTTPLKTVLRGLRNMLTDFLGEKFLSFEEYFKQKNPDHQGSVRNLLEQLKTFLEEELRTLAQISAIAVAGMSNSK